MLDTETTGLGHFEGREDGVVQIGAAYHDPATGRVVAWSEDCDPGARCHEGGRAAVAFRVNGMTPERLARARRSEEVAADLRARLAGLAEAHGPLDLRAYNLAFDRPFLEAEPWRVAGPWGACLMLEARAALDPRGKRPRLAEACAALGVPGPGAGAHDAGRDAVAALLVHEALAARRAGPQGPFSPGPPPVPAK